MMLKIAKSVGSTFHLTLIIVLVLTVAGCSAQLEDNNENQNLVSELETGSTPAPRAKNHRSLEIYVDNAAGDPIHLAFVEPEAIVQGKHTSRHGRVAWDNIAAESIQGRISAAGYIEASFSFSLEAGVNEFAVTLESSNYVDELKPDIQPVTVSRIELRFNGNECLYTGPTVITSTEFILDGDGGGEVTWYPEIGVLRGHNFDDLVEYLSPPLLPKSPPLWFPTTLSKPVIGEPPATIRTLESGSFGLACVVINSSGSLTFILASPLWVE